jgi:hypothetical protein
MICKICKCEKKICIKISISRVIISAVYWYLVPTQMKRESSTKEAKFVWKIKNEKKIVSSNNQRNKMEANFTIKNPKFYKVFSANNGLRS